MISPVERIGATPVFYPITDFGIPDLSYLQKANLDGTRAILVPHLFGLPRPLGEVADFCRSRSIALIEDCAHSFFGRAGGKAIGTTGDFAIGSLPKFFPVVEGGLLASATRRIPVGLLPARPLRHEFRAAWDMVDIAARVGRLGPFGIVAGQVSSYRRGRRRPEPAINSLAGDDGNVESLHSESLRDIFLAPNALRRTESWVVANYDYLHNTTMRRRNYRAISAALADIKLVRRPFPDCEDDFAPYVFPLLVREADVPYSRMRTAALPVFRWDRVWPNTPTFSGDAAGSWSRSLVQIACHQSLRPCEIVEICRLIRECLDHPA
jgi:hypothetical protein